MAAADARVDAFPRGLPRRRREPAAPGEWERFEAALEDDFNTPDALAVMHGWRDHELLRRALDIFGLASLADERGGADRDRRARQATAGGARRARLRRGRSAPRRDRGRGLGGARRGRRLPARPASDARPGLRPPRRCGRRCAGRREVLELWATERAVKSEPWLQRGRAPAPPGQARAGAERSGRHARPPGRARVVRALQVRRRLGARGGGASAARLPRPGHRPAQPRRGRSAARKERERPASSFPHTAPRPSRPRSRARRRVRSSIFRSQSSRTSRATSAR